MKKIEFHVHTKFSNDSILGLFFILMMCKFRKIDCLVITDHNEIDGAIKYKEKLLKYGIDVIVGEEIFTKDGEIIGLFLNKKIEPYLSAVDTVKRIRKQKGLVYIPHPYDEKRYKTVITQEALEKISKDIDFIEIHNGRNISEVFSNKQNEMADKYNLRKIVGSDAHTFYELGRNYCLVNSYEKAELISNIENAIFNKKKCIRLAHQNTKLARFIKIIGKGDFNELYRIINRKCKRKK